MEFDKDSKLLTIINNAIQIVDNKQFIININNNNLNWTEYEFNNFITSLSNSKFEQLIDDEVLQVEDENNNILEITNISNILKYCNTNQYNKLSKYKWINNKNVLNDSDNTTFDFNINLVLNEITNLGKRTR